MLEIFWEAVGRWDIHYSPEHRLKQSATHRYSNTCPAHTGYTQAAVDAHTDQHPGWQTDTSRMAKLKGSSLWPRGPTHTEPIWRWYFPEAATHNRTHLCLLLGFPDIWCEGFDAGPQLPDVHCQPCFNQLILDVTWEPCCGNTNRPLLCKGPHSYPHSSLMKCLKPHWSTQSLHPLPDSHNFPTLLTAVRGPDLFLS